MADRALPKGNQFKNLTMGHTGGNKLLINDKKIILEFSKSIGDA
jgi:hypothetical protein